MAVLHQPLWQPANRGCQNNSSLKTHFHCIAKNRRNTQKGLFHQRNEFRKIYFNNFYNCCFFVFLFAISVIIGCQCCVFVVTDVVTFIMRANQEATANTQTQSQICTADQMAHRWLA